MDRPLIQMNAAAAAGLLVAAFALSACSMHPKGNFKIDRIHYGQGARLNSEVIVVKNISSQKRMLTHFRIVDPNEGLSYTFPVTSLKPGHSVTLHTFHGRNRPGHRYWGRDVPVWNDSGDTAWLVNPQGKKIDTCHYAGGGTTADC
jgi:Lamin Tail Domain